jgi:tetratricopeptide (TPR) repeat protein
MGRMAAAEALANSGALEESRVAQRTIAFDPDKDRSTRLKAARAMLRLGLRDDAAAVARRESERPWLLIASGWDFDQVLDLLSDAGHTEEAKEVLNQVLSAGPAGIDPHDYRRVIRSLGKMGYRLEAKHLVMELNSTRYLFDHVDTLMVAEMLDELGFADDAKSVLWSLIEGSSLRDYDRVRAAEMLGKLDSEEAARAILREMIVDPSLYRSARSQAYKQLVALGDDADAVGVQLTATATNTEPKRRVDVAITLNEIGQIDKSRDLAQGVLNDAGADFASRVDAAALLGIARVAGTAKLELENMLPSSGDDLSWEQVDKLIALGITERLKQPLAERIISMDGTSEQFHAKKAIETLDKLGFGTVADDGLIEVSKSQTATDVCRNWSIAKLLERGRKEEAVAVLESAVSVEEMQPERRIATIEKLAELSDSEYLRVAISEMARRPDLATPVKRRIAEVAHKAGFATLAFDVLSDVAETATDDYGRVEAARRLAAMGFETKANEILRAAAERPGIGLSDRLYVVNAMVDAGLVDTASKAVLELSEDANGLRLDVGHLLQRLGRQTEAIGHFTKVATGDQVRPEVRLRAARELLANGADGEALEVVRQIIGTDDAPLETRIGAVETLSHAGYNAEAGEALRGILKENHAGGLVLVPAYLALGELGFKEDATAGIAAILSTTGLMPPPTAVFALADWGSPLAVEAVKTICSNVDEDRFVDVRGNRLVPLQAALEFLEELLEQGHRDVAYAGIDQLLQNRSVVAQRRLVRWTAERLLRANGDRTSRSTEDIPARMQHRFADTWERRHRD